MATHASYWLHSSELDDWLDSSFRLSQKLITQISRGWQSVAGASLHTDTRMLCSAGPCLSLSVCLHACIISCMLRLLHALVMRSWADDFSNANLIILTFTKPATIHILSLTRLSDVSPGATLVSDSVPVPCSIKYVHADGSLELPRKQLKVLIVRS